MIWASKTILERKYYG